MRAPRSREEKRFRRHLRVRKKVTGTAERPRLVIFRSLKHITAQLVDDVAGRAADHGTDLDLLVEDGRHRDHGEAAVHGQRGRSR